ncbi:hypothetical protein ENBRE01_1093 [Enteropsectra breve]|nr:hypothetical protein ENBRE01_1093 [Enteropsectra breve]
MDESSSLYSILGLGRNATPAEIKKHYHIESYKAIVAHDSELQLKINNAHTVLSDPGKKEFYDTFGADSLQYMLNSKTGYLFPIIFSKINRLLLFTYFSLNVGNLLVLLFAWNKINFCFNRFIGISLSPALLMCFLAVCNYKIKKYREDIMGQKRIFLFLIFYHIQFSVATFCIDRDVPIKWVFLSLILVLEGILAYTYGYLQDDKNEMLHSLLKAASMALLVPSNKLVNLCTLFLSICLYSLKSTATSISLFLLSCFYSISIFFWSAKDTASRWHIIHVALNCLILSVIEMLFVGYLLVPRLFSRK